MFTTSATVVVAVSEADDECGDHRAESILSLQYATSINRREFHYRQLPSPLTPLQSRACYSFRRALDFLWLLGLGIYFAYAAAGMIADDIESDRMDLLLSFPVSRSQLLLEKFASLLLPLLLLNVVVGGVTYGLVVAIGETIDPMYLALAHLLSIPYLLVCATIGLVLSVLVDRAAIAERAAIGVVFVLWLVESAVGAAEDFAWIQYVSPTHYYSPTPVLIDGTYELMDTGILLAGFLGLLIVSQVLFQRRDI